MNVKKLAEGAILSSLFIIINLIAVFIGLNYFGYIDFAVPILTGIIYLKCGFKYSILSSIISTILTIFLLGNLPLGIMMIQSILLGFITAAFIINNKGSIIDDIFYSAVLSSFLVIIFDINFSSLIGYSLIKESYDLIEDFPFLYDDYKNFVFYGSIAAIPLGSVIISYIGIILFSGKLRIKKENLSEKLYIITNFKKLGQFISCSRTTINFGTAYALIFEAIKFTGILNNYKYLNILANSIDYIALFFIIQDSFSMVNKFIYVVTKSRMTLIFSELMIICILVSYFKIGAAMLIISSYIIDKKFDIRTNQRFMLNKYICSYNKD